MEDNGKTVAIVAYCTIIGFIISIVLHSSNKTKLGAYHLRQALGLILLAIAVAIVNMILINIFWAIGLYFIIPIFSWLIMLGLLALVVIGIINAASEQEKPLPVVGPLFAKWFAGVFN